MTSARTMIRKSTANCTRTATTSSCESTTAESKSARDATSPLRHRALRHLNLSSRTANSTSTVASKDRHVYWWLNATFSTTATQSVYVLVTRTLPCATSWSRPYEPAGVVELCGVSPLLRGPQPTVYCLVTRTLRLCCIVIIVCLDYLLILYICVCENKTRVLQTIVYSFTFIRHNTCK